MTPGSPGSCVELETKIRECLQQTPRFYHHKSAITIRWEDDNSGAKHDVPHFKAFVKGIGITDIHECLISETADYIPSLHVETALANCINNGFEAYLNGGYGHYLILIHYPGHGGTDPEKGQFFCPTEDSTRRFYLRSLISRISTFSEIDGPSFDVVIIIDSNYSTAAHPTIQPKAGQTVELLAAVSADEHGDARRSADTQNTFTSKLANIIARVKESSLKAIDFATILGLAQEDSTIKMPVHRFLVGSLPIKIGIPPYYDNPPLCLPVPQPELAPGKHGIIMFCNVAGHAGSVEVQRLVQWIKGLDASVALHVDGIHECDGAGDSSTGLLLRAPFNVFYTVEPLPCVKVLFRAPFNQGNVPSRFAGSELREPGDKIPTPEPTVTN
ncbi:hypothetical protein MferCBS31731_005520 [Microsporum ferrugineum]